jgi:hypothetical protein
VSGKTNANRNQILDDLGDMGYNDIWDVMDHFKLKLESVKEAAVPAGERIQNLNNRIKALRDKLSATKSSEQKKLFQDRLKNALQTLSNIKKDYSIKKESTLNEGLGDSIKKIRNLAIKMASIKYDRAKSHLNIDNIASSDDFNGKDAMNKATAALLQQNDLDEDLKATINKIAVKLGTGATMLSIITALVSMGGWIQYLDSSFTKWYYTEIQKLAEPEVMKAMQDLGRAGQAEGSIYGKLGMYAFFIFFTIAVISLVAARMTQKRKNEYVDKKGVEHVAAALPQTEEEPVNEAKVIDIVDRFHDLKLPNIVYLNKKPYTGNAFVMNGYNGYTSSSTDGWVYDSKTRKPLTDKQGSTLRATTHRGAKWNFKNGIKESVNECKTC